MVTNGALYLCTIYHRAAVSNSFLYIMASDTLRSPLESLWYINLEQVPSLWPASPVVQVVNTMRHVWGIVAVI